MDKGIPGVQARASTCKGTEADKCQEGRKPIWGHGLYGGIEGDLGRPDVVSIRVHYYLKKN